LKGLGSEKLRLQIDKIVTHAHLGETAEERSTAQLIHINLTLSFTQAPQACITDQIDDTICYDRLARNIVEFVQSREFALVEHLSYEIYQLLYERIGHLVKIKVALEKLALPTPYILGPITCSYGD
jgi:dihydroneopterin aldolase